LKRKKKVRKLMPNPYIPLLTKVKSMVSENEVNDIKTFELEFIKEEEYKNFDYVPGQFAEISIIGKGECPIGIASSPTEEGTIKFTIKKMGTVTSSFHNSDIGDTIGVRGPLGNGWPMEELKGKNIVVIGGGFAFSTLRSLVLYVLDEKHRRDYGKITVIYGNRNSGEVLYRDVLEEFCGPPIMIKTAQAELENLGWKDEQILNSLEMRMKCGIGKCGRCNIGEKYVCIDGPVFSLAELKQMPKEH
jgi:NAD(P)H-flavin reductase